MTFSLLIVDDEAANIRLLERLFREDYFCLTAFSGAEAMTILDQHEVAVIITDQRMPQMTGIELLKKSAERRPHMVRILLTGYTDLEALVEAINCGLVYLYVSKPWNNDDLKLRVSRAVEHYENNKRQHSLAASNERLKARIKEMRVGLLRTLAGALQLRDPYLSLHAARVSRYAGLLGKRLGLSEELMSDMIAASFLHDLGTIGTVGEIYSRLAVSENVFVPQNHTGRAVKLTSCIAELQDVSDMIRYHYENFDGSGGPLGLVGDQIPLTVRILRVAKDFDLLTKPRDEGQSISHESALERLQRGAGKEFDPLVIQTFMDVATEMKNPLPTGPSEAPFYSQHTHIQ